MLLGADSKIKFDRVKSHCARHFSLSPPSTRTPPTSLSYRFAPSLPLHLSLCWESAVSRRRPGQAATERIGCPLQWSTAGRPRFPAATPSLSSNEGGAAWGGAACGAGRSSLWPGVAQAARGMARPEAARDGSLPCAAASEDLAAGPRHSGRDIYFSIFLFLEEGITAGSRSDGDGPTHHRPILIQQVSKLVVMAFFIRR